MVRLSHRDLEAWWGESTPVFRQGMGVAEKYAHWEDLCRRHGIADPRAVSFELDPAAGAVTAPGRGRYSGLPVFTGQISDCTGDKPGATTGRGKYKDFMFYAPREEQCFSVHGVDPAAWRDFLLIHGDEGRKAQEEAEGAKPAKKAKGPVSSVPWGGYWKARFLQGKPVPVFYIQDGRRLQLGLAYMPKLAGTSPSGT